MPKPNAGESEQDFVSRYMASAEARADFPDADQRAAVAYKTFGERANSTPAVETSVSNVCAECGHPLDPEHDAEGCHLCACAVTRRAITEPGQVLGNGSATCNECGRPMTADGKGGWTGHAPDCPTGEKTNAGYENDPTMQRLKAEMDRRVAADPQDAAAASWLKNYAVGVKAQAENTNANDSWLQKVAKASGVPFAEVQRKWSEHVRTVSNENPSTFQSEFLDWYGLRENSNALRPVQEAFEAHVANCNTCSAEYANAEPKPEMLCADGQKLLTAKGLENAGEPTEPVTVSKGAWAGNEGPGKTFTIPPKPVENGLSAPWTCDACGADLPTDDAVKAHKSDTGHSSYKGLQNSEKDAKGGDEFGKPGGTVTVVNSGPGKTTKDGKTIDEVSREMTGKAYRALPDDGPAQEEVMRAFEQRGGVAQQAFNSEVGNSAHLSAEDRAAIGARRWGGA